MLENLVVKQEGVVVKLIKKICNHCGRIYEGVCPCQKKRRAEQVARYEGDPFYRGLAWRSLSRAIRNRDLNADRLAMYLSGLVLSGVNLSGYRKILADYLILPGGAIRRLSGGIVVHHIIPKEEDMSLAYVAENLISLRHDTHEYVHQLYKTEAKADVQELLREAVSYDCEASLF